MWQSSVCRLGKNVEGNKLFLESTASVWCRSRCELCGWASEPRLQGLLGLVKWRWVCPLISRFLSWILIGFVTKTNGVVNAEPFLLRHQWGECEAGVYANVLLALGPWHFYPIARRVLLEPITTHKLYLKWYMKCFIYWTGDLKFQISNGGVKSSGCCTAIPPL